MKRQAGNVALVVLIVLALSLLANWWLWKSLDGAQHALTAAETKLTAANAETQRCNDSIAGLEEAARKRGAAQEKARAAAAERRRQAEAEAHRIMGTPAAIPGDDCGSAKKRVDDWLRSRQP